MNTKKTIEIMRRLKTEMNGAVADAMKERGMNYGLNYGVSAVTVRDVARYYAPDHSLALHLFEQDVRELKLAAIYIDDPAKVTQQQMNLWMTEPVTDEIAEHCATALFYAAPCAEETAKDWIAGANVKAALLMIGKRAATGLLSDGGDFLRLIEKGVNSVVITKVNSCVYALCKIGGMSQEMRAKVEDCLTRLANREIVDETRALLL